MKFISAEDIAAVFDYTEFIPLLKEAFLGDFTVPQRHHYEYENGVGENTSTLLLMPAWSNGRYVGIKTVTVSPYNGEFDLPSIQGIYTLIDAKNGMVKTQMEAKMLTVKRTAATSALASLYLSREDATTLLMVGTGALAPELIMAHHKVRPIQKVLIWGRSIEKAEVVKEQLAHLELKIEVVASLEDALPKADIISVATLSREPLVLGKWLLPGQHLDLVGAYRPDMRETDDEALKRSSIFIDHPGALRESGDLAIPLEQGGIQKEDIQGELKDLGKAGKLARKTDREITIFKSVGHALEDLSAALYVMKKLRS
ncbi:MAG: ornithine cyclodeaminase family protein [Roseivirga sp.]|nr:ornithine cyclodeaminase family protein [Roseivirga sp.]